MRNDVKILLKLSVIFMTICSLSINIWAMDPERVRSTASAPILLIPENGVQITELVGEQKLTFSWTKAPRAAYYQFQLCTDIYFNNCVLEVNDCEENRYTVTSFIDNVTYYWRVRSVSAGGIAGEWSETFRFILGYPDESKKEGLYEKGVQIGVASLAARKDTNILCLDGCAKTGTHRWDASHVGAASTGDHSQWGCWAAATAMMNHHYGGTITQDEVRYKVKGKDEPEEDFAHGNAGGANDAETTTGLGWALKDGSLEYSRTKLTEAQIKVRIDANRPVMQSTPVHWMVLDGYRNAGADFEVRMLNIDNNGAVAWQKFSTQAYDSHFCPPANSSGRTKDAKIDLDSDGDGINDFDEEKRFITSKTNRDTDDDEIDDKIEIQSYIFDKDGNYISKTAGRHAQVMAHFDGDKLRPEKDSDTDDGGIKDGKEDINKDGILDPDHEIDPYEPKDDKGVVFCIDDTGSMGEEISAAKAAAYKVLNDNKAANIKRYYSLLSFKDGAGVLRGQTPDIDIMKGYIDALYASGGAGCPESSQLTIRQAAELGKDSDIFMITDASSNSYGVDDTYASWGEIAETIYKLLFTNSRLHSIVYSDCSAWMVGAGKGEVTLRDREAAQCQGCFQNASSRRLAAADDAHGLAGYSRTSGESGGLFFHTTSGETEKAAEIILRTASSDSTIAFIDGDGSSAYTVPLDASVTQLQLVANADATASISMEVKNPSGTVVTHDPVGGVSVLVAGGSTFYLIEGAALSAGNWTATVTGTGTYRLSAKGQTANPMSYTGATSAGVGSSLLMEVTFKSPVAGLSFDLVKTDGSTLMPVTLTTTDNLTYHGSVVLETLGSFRFKATGAGYFQRMPSGKITVGSLDMVAPTSKVVSPGAVLIHSFQLKNLGTEEGTFNLYGSSSMGWADLSTLPGKVTLSAGGSEAIDITVNVPADAVAGQIDTLSLQAVMVGNSTVNDAAETETRVAVMYDLDGDGDVDVVDIMQVASRWNTSSSDDNYDARYDLNSDGKITVGDIMMVAAQWGWTAP